MVKRFNDHSKLLILNVVDYFDEQKTHCESVEQCVKVAAEAFKIFENHLSLEKNSKFRCSLCRHNVEKCKGHEAEDQCCYWLYNDRASVILRSYVYFRTGKSRIKLYQLQ